MDEADVRILWDKFTVLGYLLGDSAVKIEMRLKEMLAERYNSDEFIVDYTDSGNAEYTFLCRQYYIEIYEDEDGEKLERKKRGPTLIHISRLPTHDNKIRLRVEYNPNNLPYPCSDILHLVTSILSDKEVSRADLAFDIPIDMSTFKILNSTATRMEIYGRSGAKETQYYGKRASEKQIRIYDKRKELKAHKKFYDEAILNSTKDWWRLEVQMRRRSSLEFEEKVVPILENIHTIENIDKEKLKIQDYLALISLSEHQELWGLLSQYQRSKYRKLLREAAIESQLSKLLKKRLADEIPRLLAEFDKVVSNVEMSKF